MSAGTQQPVGHNPVREHWMAPLPSKPEKDSTDALLQERKKAHGDWHKQATLAQHLKSIVTTTDSELEPHQQEALEMICVKISRILTGDPNHADHWDDIAGYARLGKQGHGK